jgi:hypothetical protein
MFGAPESHNTKRVASLVAPELAKRFSIAMWALSSFLPVLVPNLLCGYELLETLPVNTGLGFSAEEAGRFFDNMSADEREKNPEAPKLSLFSRGSLPWTNGDNLIEHIARVNRVRGAEPIREILQSSVEMEIYNTHNAHILGICTLAADEKGSSLVFLLNLDWSQPQKGRFYGRSGEWIFMPAATGDDLDSDGGCTIQLDAGSFALYFKGKS